MPGSPAQAVTAVARGRDLLLVERRLLAGHGAGRYRGLNDVHVDDTYLLTRASTPTCAHSRPAPVCFSLLFRGAQARGLTPE